MCMNVLIDLEFANTKNNPKTKWTNPTVDD
jgi:hypothetical protein